eukprot:scaffold825_cov249-Pinguiococcus_pyrenoidosus.AAC.69
MVWSSAWCAAIWLLPSVNPSDFPNPSELGALPPSSPSMLSTSSGSMSFRSTFLCRPCRSRATPRSFVSKRRWLGELKMNRPRRSLMAP